MLNLEQQLLHLDNALLGSVQSSLPSLLSEHEKAQVNAYLVLAHAVLEEHLESLFLEHFDRIAAQLSQPIVPVECVRLVFAVAEDIHGNHGVSYAKRNTIELVRRLGRKNLESKLHLNNGIKSKDVQKLAKCVGLEWPEFEDSLNAELADLDTLGTKRGSAGHLSPYTDRVTSIEDHVGPDDVRSWVTAGRTALEQLEGYLSSVIPG